MIISAVLLTFRGTLFYPSSRWSDRSPCRKN